MGGARLFNYEDPQKDERLLRLPPGYNLNALWYISLSRETPFTLAHRTSFSHFLNRLRYYEHGGWHLYGCHKRFHKMKELPGLAMTFPVAPFIKVHSVPAGLDQCSCSFAAINALYPPSYTQPWNWWPYLILDDNWNIWQDIRSELGTYTS
jgi:hypothetical protein